MKENGIHPPRRKKRVPITTDSRHSHRIAPNLLEQNFQVSEPNTVWLADISYIPTDEGWLYLAAVKDLGTMEIVGWAMSDHLKSDIAINALTMAIGNRQPTSGPHYSTQIAAFSTPVMLIDPCSRNMRSSHP